jgi:hypothetical protein
MDVINFDKDRKKIKKTSDKSELTMGQLQKELEILRVAVAKARLENRMLKNTVNKLLAQATEINERLLVLNVASKNDGEL